jgi:protein ImuB
VVALLVPNLPLQRVARGREPAGGEARPLAVVAEGRVLCADGAARAEGVRSGATAAEALAACGRLALVPADTAADRGALRALAEAMLGIAPAVELAGTDVLLLDASAAHLLQDSLSPGFSRGRGGPGSRESEEHLAARAVAVAAEMGYAARAAVATGRGPARALVRHAQGPVSWIPADGTVGALAVLPIGALGLAADVVARLGAVGIDRVGALAALPEGTLAHRFGPAGVHAARLARGEDDSPLVPHVPDALPDEGLELEAPAESAEPLLFGLKRLADRVSARLAGRGLGACRLRVVLKLDPRGEERILVPLAAPTPAASRWLLLLKEHLFSLRLPAAVIALRLAAVEVAPVPPEQLAIGDRPEALAALEGVLARLAVRLGAGALFAAEPVDRHRPEGAYRAVPFRAPRRARGERTGTQDGVEEPAPARPTRLVAVPAPVVA